MIEQQSPYTSYGVRARSRCYVRTWGALRDTTELRVLKDWRTFPRSSRLVATFLDRQTVVCACVDVEPGRVFVHMFHPWRE